MRRRQFLGAVAGSASVALAGCSGDTSGSGSTTTTDSCRDDNGTQFCLAREFQLKVKQRVQSPESGFTDENSDPPQLLEGGVFKNDNGEVITDTVVQQMVAENEPFSFMGTMQSDMVYIGSAFAHYYPGYNTVIEKMIISIFADSEAKKYRGKVTIFGDWASKFNKGEWTATEYVDTIIQTWEPA